MNEEKAAPVARGHLENAEGRLAYRPREFARKTGTGYAFVLRQIRAGNVEVRPLGAAYLIPAIWVEKFLAGRPREAA